MSSVVTPVANTVDQDAALLRSIVEKSTILVDSLRQKLFLAEDKLAAIDANASTADKKALQASISTAESRLIAAQGDFNRAEINFNAYVALRNATQVKLSSDAAAISKGK